MASLEAYLSKKMPFDNSVLECISKSSFHDILCFPGLLLTCLLDFLDHLMRQWPASQYTLIKRSFFTKGTGYTHLDNYVSALKGVYSSIRLCSLQPSMGGIGTGLAVNVDVANGTFWTARKLFTATFLRSVLTLAVEDVHQAARNFCGAFGNRQGSYTVFRDSLFPVKSPQTGKITWPEAMKHLHKMSKLKFHLKHRGKEESK
jgi:eukaryotic translation initiation factor 2C